MKRKEKGRNWTRLQPLRPRRYWRGKEASGKRRCASPRTEGGGRKDPVKKSLSSQKRDRAPTGNMIRGGGGKGFQAPTPMPPALREKGRGEGGEGKKRRIFSGRGSRVRKITPEKKGRKKGSNAKISLLVLHYHREVKGGGGKKKKGRGKGMVRSSAPLFRPLEQLRREVKKRGKGRKSFRDETFSASDLVKRKGEGEKGKNKETCASSRYRFRARTQLSGPPKLRYEEGGGRGRPNIKPPDLSQQHN